MVFRKVSFMKSRMPIFSLMGYTLKELFRKPDNWRPIYKQTNWTFYTSNGVSRRKNISTSKVLLNCEIAVFFLKKCRSSHWRCRSSHRRCCIRKSILKNFANFTWKQLCRSLFLWSCRPSGCKLCCKVCKTFKNTYFEEHLQTTACGGVLYIKLFLKTLQYSQDESS